MCVVSYENPLVEFVGGDKSFAKETFELVNPFH